MTKTQQLLHRYPQHSEILARFIEYVDTTYPSTRQFCQQSGINQTQLARVLRGESIFSADMLLKLSELGVDMNWLLRGVQAVADEERAKLLFYIDKLEGLIRK